MSETLRDRLVRLLSPPDDKVTPEQQLQLPSVISVDTIAAIVATVMSVQRFAISGIGNAQGWLLAGCAASFVVLLTVLKHTGWIELVKVVSVGVTFPLFIGLAFIEAGLRSSVFMWIPLIPLIAYYGLGSRPSRVLLVLSLPAVWIIYAAQLNGMIPDPVEPESSILLTFACSATLALVFAAVTAQLAEMRQQRSQAALDAALRAANLTIDAIPDTVIRLERDGTVAAVSFGASVPTSLEGDVVGHRFVSAFGPDNEPALNRALTEAGTGDSDEFETILITDTEDRAFEVRVVAPMPDTRFAIVRDVTDLNRQQRAKDEFIATLTHEVRTPIQGVLGATRLLEDEPLTDDQRSLVRMIGDSALALRTLTNDVLDISRMRAVGVTLMPVKLDVKDLLRSVVEMFSTTAESKGVELAMFVDFDLERFQIYDETRMRQVLTNLVGNAVKFTDKGHVSVRVCRAESEVVFEVEDTGPGISKARQSSVFEPFTQADDTIGRTYGGTGLGLSIARQIVRQMGGEILVQSDVGVGSTFVVRLPGNPVVRQPAFQAFAGSGTAGRQLVLFLPEGPTREVFERVASQAGILVDVVPADGYTQVVVILATADTEVQIAQVRDTYASPRIVVVGGPEAVAKCRRRVSGAYAFLSYPIDQDRIGALVSDGDWADSFAGGAARPSSGAFPAATEFPLRILVVDDDEINRLVTARMLQRLGYTPDFAVNGAVAVERVRELQPDVIFMDLRMPVMDGIEATRLIREMTSIPQPYIYGVTAHDHSAQLDPFRAAGVDEVLEKPLNNKDLKRVLQLAVKRSLQRIEEANSPA